MGKKKRLPLGKVYQLLEPGPVVLVTSCLDGKKNVMAMSWQTMLEFEPPQLACVISNRNYSFELVRGSGECVINVPTVEMVETVVKVGNVSGRRVDKFKRFGLECEEGSKVGAPLLKDCYASLECKVIDTGLVEQYCLFILQVVQAWVRPKKETPRLIHHWGDGVFTTDSDPFKLPSKKK